MILPQIRAAVAAIRGLQPSGAVAPVVIDEATLRRNLQAEYDAEYPPAELEKTEHLLATLGLLEVGASLRDLNLDLQAGQVAGYYSPDRDELYVVSRSGGIGPVEWATYAHEYTHQLQDQNFDLDGLGLDAIDQSDRSLARLALIEGDASITQQAWMQEALTPAELGEIVRASLDPEGLAALQRAPLVLRETALFPYREGLGFATFLATSGGFDSVNAAYDDLPSSTEQVIHPEKYLAREAPLQVVVPEGAGSLLGAGWREEGRDTLGELYLRTWLRAGGLGSTEARAAAGGWGGDRVVLFEGPGGAHAALLVTTWDALEDAAEFAASAERTLGGLGVTGRVVFDERLPTVYVALGDRADDLAPVFFGG